MSNKFGLVSLIKKAAVCSTFFFLGYYVGGGCSYFPQREKDPEREILTERLDRYESRLGVLEKEVYRDE